MKNNPFHTTVELPYIIPEEKWEMKWRTAGEGVKNRKDVLVYRENILSHSYGDHSCDMITQKQGRIYFL